MTFGLPDVLTRLRPGAKWSMSDINDYESIQWLDDIQIQPTLEECETKKIELQNEEKINNYIRKPRNYLLDKSDKYATIDYPHANDEIKRAWLDYRQALRDLPTTVIDPEDFVLPTPPQ
jgi:hypothetical protein